MNEHDPGNPELREAEINALLDGELDQASATELKAAAAEDGVLAQAIIDAWQLHKSVDELRMEKAPASLSRKLKRIPREQKAAAKSEWSLGLPRWALAGAMATVPLLALLLVMNTTINPDATEEPQVAVETISEEQRLQQTQRDLETAFYYLDKVGFRLGQQINEVLNEEIAAPVKDNFSRYMPFTGQSKKEKHV
jgi:anti-sigma factor RsiW